MINKIDGGYEDWSVKQNYNTHLMRLIKNGWKKR
jgi:hypothetical protein